MTRLTTKTLEEAMESARELLQDSIVTKLYELTYQASVADYILPGFSSNDPRILSIEAIEGINFVGNWTTEEDLEVGVDYDLYQQYDTVDLGYGAASGEDLYQGISIAVLSFKDNSTVYIRYKYQSPDFLPVLTNFAGSSQLLMFLSAIFSNVQQDLVSLASSIDAFGINSSGEDLDRLGTIAGLEKTTAIQTTGSVQITNDSSSETFTIAPETRFVARSQSFNIAFKSESGSGSVGPLSTATISVIAVDGGKLGNVGSYSITTIFTDAGLTTRALSYVSVTNPPLISGSPNEFNNGADEESEEAFRKRIQLTFQSFKTSSYSSLEKAAFDTGFLSDVTAFDIRNRKGIPLHSNIISLQTPAGNILSPTAISSIQAAVDAVQATGQFTRYEQTMHAYLSIDADVFVDASILEDTTDLDTTITNTLTAHINAKTIGADIFPSTLLALIISSISVKDAVLNETKLTEYVSELSDTDTEIELSNSSGAEENRIAVELKFNSIKWTETDQYDGANAYLDVANTPIDETIDPRVNKAVFDYNDEYRPSPLNVTDFFASVTVSGTRINFTPGEDPTDPIVSGEYVFYDYNQYDNLILDGIRVVLDGVDGQYVDVQINYGSTPFGTLLHADTQQIITLNGNEEPKLYEVLFDNPVTFDPASNKYWIIITAGGTNNNITKIPLDSANQLVPLNPELYIDGWAESTPAPPDGTYERAYMRAIYHSFKKISGATVYEKIVIPSRSQHSESSRMLDTVLTFKEFVEE